MRFRIGVDTGGTFTDLCALDDEDRFHLHKLPSNPAAPAEVVMAGLAGLAETLNLCLDDFLPQCDVIILGSTVALNTLIQRRGTRTALLTTSGHEDSLEIRLGHKEDGHRWDFAFPPAKPLVPAALRLPVQERVLQDGTVDTPLDEAAVRETVRTLRDDSIGAVAISLLWSFLHPEHEERVVAIVREELPDCFLSVSSRVLPRVGEYARVSTTVTNAYVGPALHRYMTQMEAALAEQSFSGRVYYMQSNGGVAGRDQLAARPVVALNSGPAAGPGAAAHFAALAGVRDLISIDMGGTSFDVCVARGGLPDIVPEVDIARYRIGMPMVNVTSIGAGGGSIAHIDERGLLQVGPQSAEAYPGPACYGRGGTAPTVTDALVVLGYLSGRSLLGGRMEIRHDLAVDVVATGVALPLGLDVVDAAQGVVQIASTNMVDGIRMASIERGYDPRDFALVAGGGAGPAFAGLLASELGIDTVLVPKAAGALCAFGEAVADLRYDAVRSYPVPLSRAEPERLAEIFAELEEEGRSAFATEIERAESVTVERMAEMKYVDQVHYCDVAVTSGVLDEQALHDLRRWFHERHEQLYSFSERDNEPEIISLRASTIVASTGRAIGAAGARMPAASEQSRMVVLPNTSAATRVPVFVGASVAVDAEIEGPAVIEEETTTIVVFPGSTAELVDGGVYVMRVHEPVEFRRGERVALVEQLG